MPAALMARAGSLKSRCLTAYAAGILRPRVHFATRLSLRQLSSVAQNISQKHDPSFGSGILPRKTQYLTSSPGPRESIDLAVPTDAASRHVDRDESDLGHDAAWSDRNGIQKKQLSSNKHRHPEQKLKFKSHSPKRPFFVRKRRYMITYDRLYRSHMHNAQPTNRFSAVGKAASKPDEPSQETYRELKNLRGMHSQWGYVRHRYSDSQRQSARKDFTFWKTKFWKVSRPDKPEEPKLPWPWRDNAKWLFELNGVRSMQQAWKSLEIEDRRKQWPLIMISTLDRCPDKAQTVLEATLDPLPPGYAINDVLLFVAQRLRISGIRNVRERTLKAEEVLELVAKVLEDTPSGHVPLGQRTAGLFARKLPSEQASELYSMLQRANVKLHPNTLLQFASKLAGDMAHKDTAFEIIKSLADSGVDLNAPSPSSAITTLLHCRIAHGGSSESNSSFSPKDTLEYFMDRGFVPNVINATAFLDSLCQRAEVEEAIRLTLLFSESGVQLDTKAWSTIFRGAKGSLKVENVAKSLDVAKAANAPYVDVLNNALHAVFYFAEMESREKRLTAPWIYPLFGPMLRAYAKKFELEPLQWWLPDSLPLVLTQTTGNDGEKFDGNQLQRWDFLETIVPLTEKSFSAQSSGPKLQPNTTTIAIMLRAYVKTLQHPYDLMAFYAFFKARLEEQGGKEGIAAQLIKDQGSLIHDTIIMAMMERRGLSRPALQVFGDMLKDHLQRNATERTERSTAAPVHPPPGLCTFSILVRGLFNSGDRILAEQVIHVMKEQGVEPNLVTWNTLTKGYAAMQNINKTVSSLHDMEAAGFKPDLFTFKAFAKLRNQGRALEMMEGIIDVNRQNMAGEDLISQFTSVFRASDAHRVRRCRQTVSCAACQRRKSRCDRQHPCGACEKRGGGGSCSYGSAAASAVSDKAAGSSRRDVQLKLNQLEQMVRGLAEKRAGGGGERRSGSDRDEPETRYHGATSWTALVEGIRDIQDILVADQESGSPGEAAEPEILLGDMPPITIMEVMESLPSRQDADKVILAYFKAKFIAVCFIHTHQFKRRYDAFWADPSSASFLWISILFSILSIGTMITNAKEPDTLSSSSSSSSSAPDSRFYMVKAAQCLTAGQYLKGKRFSVEALLMHAHSRNVQKLDSDSSLWSLYGLVVRLAQKQGYHRDAAKIPGSRAMTPFEAEMRRRTWFLIQSTDLLFSFQNGMPPIIMQDACDVGHPTNLTDDDFDEGCVSLPAPRPPTDPLPILAYIAKSGLCSVMRRVVRHVLAVALAPYSDTLALDQELREWHDSVPACLRIRTIRNTAFTDANYTIMHRLMLELMYLKSLCILHRPYLTTHKHDVEYNASRQVCRESALMILEMQAGLDIETGSGGRMYEDRFMVSNLTLHHFLLAAMIICLDVSESTDIESEERLKRITTLRTAYSIWSARSTTSADALHASRVLRAILNRIDSPASTNSGPMANTPSSSHLQNYGSVPAIPDDAMQQIMPPGVNDTYATDDTLFVNGMGVALPSFEDMFANIDMFDWSSLDQYIQWSDSRSWRQFFSDTSL